MIYIRGQILIAVGGVGYYQERGKAAVRMEPSDIIEIAPHIEHWHGAAPESWFSHIAITPNLVDSAVTEFGKIDVLLNNAGLMPLSPLEYLKVEDWDRCIDVNIKGVLYGIAAALPYMKEQKSGQIISVSSVAGHTISPGGAVYSASKYSVRVISEALRQEVKPYNIRTAVISPGAVATNLPSSITAADVSKGIHEYYEQNAISADSFARSLEFIINQPEDMDVNEILFRPTVQQL